MENGGQRWNEPPLFHPPRSRLGPVSSRPSPLPVDGFGSLSSANGSPKPHPHPLRNLEKNYEKSWDSFIDSSKEDEKDVSLVTKSTVQFKNTTRGFIGMGVFGRKTMDKEKFVIDTDDEPVSPGNSASAPASHTFTSVFSRLAVLNPFGGRQQDRKPRPISPPMHFWFSARTPFATQLVHRHRTCREPEAREPPNDRDLPHRKR
jgi:hypothetical protein